MKRDGKKIEKYGWILGLGVGVVCLLVGIMQGQLTDIFRKAVMICLECIGIG